ncbi:hypothetical protein C0584_01475 [Candidatus Parcubacteria bacterium]|nr:MAG: hypothetical protein C0584_01475 [Candidatus Parcubacteria bacterium]
MSTIMDNNEEKEILQISWNVPEFEKHNRSNTWYIVAGLTASFLLIFAIFTSNYLFAIIIIATSIITIVHDGNSPDNVNVTLSSDGVAIGSKVFDYDDLKNFSVLFKPNEELKNLYFEFKNPAKQRLSIPLLDNNPLQIRNFLLKYLDEDLDRTNIPLSEGLSKLLKI